jgi:hypothetical protein
VLAFAVLACALVGPLGEPERLSPTGTSLHGIYAPWWDVAGEEPADD